MHNDSKTDFKCLKVRISAKFRLIKNTSLYREKVQKGYKVEKYF